MEDKRKILSGLFSLITSLAVCQNSMFSTVPQNTKSSHIYGFIRGGFYTAIDKNDDKLYVPSAFSDFGLKAEIEDFSHFKAFADMRFRYGTEFGEHVNKLDIREAYVKVNGRKWDIAAGQIIIKRGRADFTNPTSSLSPRNMIYRSPDREDMDMGNLLLASRLYPSDFIDFEFEVIPYYRSSVLIIDPVPVPDYVTIRNITSLITGKEMFSYGFKADFHVRSFDWSFSWFDGFDPMPGITLSMFNLDLSGPEPVPYTELTVEPYRNRVIGVDFETIAGSVGFRGEAAWAIPDLSWQEYEYVPLPEIKWVAGFDWSSGSWHFTGEYSGKYLPDFISPQVDPFIGTEPDYSKLAEMLSIPGFDIEGYFRQQVGVFNRLFNYQLERYYHNAGLRVESDLLYGKMQPSVFTMYNFNSRDLLVIPEMKLKLADGLTITAGAELYYGRSGSLFDLVNDFMNGFYVSMRVDF